MPKATKKTTKPPKTSFPASEEPLDADVDADILADLNKLDEPTPAGDLMTTSPFGSTSHRSSEVSTDSKLDSLSSQIPESPVDPNLVVSSSPPSSFDDTISAAEEMDASEEGKGVQEGQIAPDGDISSQDSATDREESGEIFQTSEDAVEMENTTIQPDMSGEEEDKEGGSESVGTLPIMDGALRESEQVDDHQRMKNIVEGALFVAGRPVTLDELNVKTDIKKKDLETLIAELTMDYLQRATALEVVQIQDKYSLQIKPEYTPQVKKFASGGLIPDAVLKTLTIVALKQPMLKSMLIKMRGATAYDHVKFLIDRGFLSSTKKGRSEELRTTDQFADNFGLSRDLEVQKKQMIAQLNISSQ